MFIVLKEGKSNQSSYLFFLCYDHLQQIVFVSLASCIFSIITTVTCSCQHIAAVFLPFPLTVHLYFRELIHLLTHLSEALHEAQLKLILVIPPAVAAG